MTEREMEVRMRTRLRRTAAMKETVVRGRRVDPTMPEDQAENYALEVAGRIVAARKEAGLTQVELAELVDVSPRSMQGYENAEVIPYRKMTNIARVLNRPVEWLLHGEDAVLPSDEKLDQIIGKLDLILEKLASQ